MRLACDVNPPCVQVLADGSATDDELGKHLTQYVSVPVSALLGKQLRLPLSFL
jgi:hypothetical protein